MRQKPLDELGCRGCCGCCRAYRFGYEVGRYVSLERLAEDSKERYYETLEQSSQG